MHSDHPTLPSHEPTICRGSRSCPHAVPVANLQQDIEAVVLDSGWAELVTGKVHPVRRHHQFRIAVAMCPNGCSRPHIADFGLIATARIAVHPDRCSSCGLCLDACAENALRITPRLTLDARQCLGCTACVRACPTGAIAEMSYGYKVVLGGKLGRHPLLAHELGIFSPDRALHVLTRSLHVLMANYRPGLRLGQLVAEMGQDNFNRQVRP